MPSANSDDTSVAIVEKSPGAVSDAVRIHFLENVTSDSREYRGIHPLLALESHQENIAKLVNKALVHLPDVSENNDKNGGNRSRQITLSDGSSPRRKPDFISTTRGPGMRSNLATGLDTGKGLSVAWQIPFVGVHHMQAHLLTPRLVSSLDRQDSSSSNTATQSQPILPEFPFLSILVSGGHTILVKSASATDHEVMASTVDIAIGEALDKAARDVVPGSFLEGAKSTMYGKLIEQFAFPHGTSDYADYRPPMVRSEEVKKRESPWGWTLPNPFANTRYMQFSFTSISTSVSRLVELKEKTGGGMAHDERVALAREAMRTCFEHLASRTIIALQNLKKTTTNLDGEVKTLVVSGGVAANKFLMTVLRSFLDVRGFEHVNILAPPPYLCTDNAAMIGWAGIEMFEAGWHSDLSCRALRKWTLDARANDGGVLGPRGWKKMHD